MCHLARVTMRPTASVVVDSCKIDVALPLSMASQVDDDRQCWHRLVCFLLFGASMSKIYPLFPYMTRSSFSAQTVATQLENGELWVICQRHCVSRHPSGRCVGRTSWGGPRAEKRMDNGRNQGDLIRFPHQYGWQGHHRQLGRKRSVLMKNIPNFQSFYIARHRSSPLHSNCSLKGWWSRNQILPCGNGCILFCTSINIFQSALHGLIRVS